jgi:hypothetical protein
MTTTERPLYEATMSSGHFGVRRLHLPGQHSQKRHGGKGGGGGVGADELPKPPAAPKDWDLGKHGDTQALYSSVVDGKRVYHPERARLHEQIVNDALDGLTPSANPTLHMMGGGPASAKSTVLEQGKAGLTTEKGNAVHVDSDAIKGKLPEYNAMNKAGNGQSARIAHEESSDISKMMIAEAQSRGIDINYDSTGDSTYGGYKVNATYTSLDSDLAWKIAEARGNKTGRHVPEHVVRGTHSQVSAIVPEAVNRGLFDSVTLFDTNIKDAPREVMRSVNGVTTIVDQQLWRDFTAKAGD